MQKYHKIFKLFFANDGFGQYVSNVERATHIIEHKKFVQEFAAHMVFDIYVPLVVDHDGPAGTRFT